ncbi:hypothetical protein F5880DRAFT_1454614, partial [Lentinula raphanica]
LTEEHLLSLTSRECIWRFHFSAPKIIELAEALDIPDSFKTQNHYSFTAVEALALLLAQFRTGSDQFELTSRYNQSQSSLSELLNELNEYLNERWAHLLDCDSEVGGILHPDKLLSYADAITASGAPLENCFAFLDCTIQRICHPSIDQQICYNGYKKIHALKYQALCL